MDSIRWLQSNFEIFTIEKINSDYTAIAFHPTLNLMALANQQKLFIIDRAQKRVIKSIKIQNSTITLLLFLDSLPYLTAVIDNKTIVQYRYKEKLYPLKLCCEKKTITAIAHHKKYIAYGDHKGTFKIIDIYSHAEKTNLKTTMATLCAIAFVTRKRVICANANGTIFIIKTENDKIVKKIDTQKRNIIQILTFKKLPYALIVTKSSNILLFHTKKLTVVKQNFISFEKELFLAMLLNDSELLLYFDDNTTEKISLASQEELKDSIKKRELLKAFKIIHSNPMLKDRPEALKAENLYKKLYNRATLQLFLSGNKKPLALLKPYESIESKKDDIKNTLLSYKNYKKFCIFYKEYRYNLAYALCEKYPALKIAPEYKKMEKEYKKRFLLAQKQLLKQKRENAQKLLLPYITIPSKRAMIQLLLRDNRAFLEFLEAISKKEYKKATTLAIENPLFKETPSYKKIEKKLKKKLKNIKKLITNAKITKADKRLQKLQNISILKKEIKEIYSFIEKAKKLLCHYEQNNFKACYETIDNNNELNSMQLAILLENHWNRVIDQCELFALEGNAKKVIERMQELIGITTREKKIKTLLQTSFYIKIEKELKNHNYKNAENFIYSYIDIFKTDEKIETLIKKLENISHIKLAISIVPNYERRD